MIILRNREYWRSRQEELARIQAKKADKAEREIIKEYEKAAESMKRDIEVFYARYAKTNDISMAEARKQLDKSELKGWRLTLDEFREKALSDKGQFTQELDNEYIRSRVSRLEALQTQVRHNIDILKQKQEKTTESTLKSVYSDTYNSTVQNILDGFSVNASFSQINETAAKEAVYTKWLDGNNFSSRIWNDRDRLVRETSKIINQGVIRGDDAERMIKALEGRLAASRSNAARLIQTEYAKALEDASFKSYADTGCTEYEISTSLDAHTCGDCGGMEGKNFKVIERRVGVNAPPFHPNCRCCTVPYYSDTDDKAEIERLKREIEKKLEKNEKSDIIKSIEIDDFKMIAEIKDIHPKVINNISEVIKDYEKRNEIYISQFNFNSFSSTETGVPLFQIEPIADKTLCLNVNNDILKGISLKEIDERILKSKKITPKNLKEAIVHECGHAKLLKGLTIKEIKELYAVLKDVHIDNISAIAFKDGAEALAEMEVLLYRGDTLSKEAQALYDKYMKR